MKLKDLLSGYCTTEEEIIANVRQEGSLFDRASAEALIQQARQEWPVQFDGEEGAPEELTPLEACVSCYLRGMYVAKSQIDIMVDRVEALNTKVNEKAEQIEKAYYAISRVYALNKCFLDFCENGTEALFGRSEQEQLLLAGQFMDRLIEHHSEELYLCGDLLEEGIAELDEAMHEIRVEKAGEVAE